MICIHLHFEDFRLFFGFAAAVVFFWFGWCTEDDRRSGLFTHGDCFVQYEQPQVGGNFAVVVYFFQTVRSCDRVQWYCDISFFGRQRQCGCVQFDGVTAPRREAGKVGDFKRLVGGLGGGGGGGGGGRGGSLGAGGRSLASWVGSIGFKFRHHQLKGVGECCRMGFGHGLEQSQHFGTTREIVVA